MFSLDLTLILARRSDQAVVSQNSAEVSCGAVVVIECPPEPRVPLDPTAWLTACRRRQFSAEHGRTDWSILTEVSFFPRLGGILACPFTLAESGTIVRSGSVEGMT